MQAASTDSLTKLIPGASHSLSHLSDSELLASTRHLVGKSNQLLAALLVHLAEVEARGVYRTRACSSLYTYCIYELRFSEDAAARRAGAAKLVKRFPALLDAVASGELHLTGLLMLGPHLTPENQIDVLARAKLRTKKELSKLIRALAPLPAVPDRIEPLGPEPAPIADSPTWEEFVQSLGPLTRELAPGKRPRDWANDTLDLGDTELQSTELSASSGQLTHAPARAADQDLAHAPASPARATDQALAHVPASPARGGGELSELPPLSGPQPYQMQFTTSEEHIELVERAKALLSRQAPSGLGELHLQAMRMLVTVLEKRKFAATARSGQPPSPAKQAAADVWPRETASSARAEASNSRHTTGDAPGPLEASRAGSSKGQNPPRPRRRSRYIPAAERRAVFERDVGRYAYVDERGERCRETHGLEIHHLKAFAKGGEHHAANLALRCTSHNLLAAEQDYGREHVARKRDASRHEPLRSVVSSEQHALRPADSPVTPSASRSPTPR